MRILIKTVFVVIGITLLMSLIPETLGQSNFYESKTYGFSIQIPPGLNFEDKEFGPNSPLMAIGELIPELQTHDRIFAIGFSDISKLEWGESTDQEILDIVISEMTARCDGFSLIESSVISVDGKKAYQIICSRTDPQTTTLEAVIPDGQNFWWILASATGEQSTWKQYEDSVKTSIQSFTLYEKISEPTPESKIPDWVKNNAKWWSESSIGDSDFIGGIQFMIKENIISIPDLPESASETTEGVPDWVRNNAGWWADGLISDNDFVSGIKYLVEQGIIKI